MAEFSQLPREDEILKLPRWAKVAFAARCARCVQSLFITSWPEAPENYVEAIETAIRLAEDVAAVGAASNVAAAKYATADASNKLASSSVDADIAANAATVDEARFAALAARFAIATAIAADCANAADLAAADSDNADASENVSIATADDFAAAAMCTANAAKSAQTKGSVIYATFAASFDSQQRRVFSQRIRVGFEFLIKKAISEGWNDRSPVTPEVFRRMSDHDGHAGHSE